jgi:hypothetical protein
MAQPPTPAATVAQLQHQLERFRTLYNTQRPHRALGRRFPADVWTHAPKSGPSAQPLGAPTIVQDRIVDGGRAYAGPYAITIGATYNGQRALTVITRTTCHVFIDGHLIRQLTLNPHQRNQPLHNRSGRPTTVTERKDARHA